MRHYPRVAVRTLAGLAAAASALVALSGPGAGRAATTTIRLILGGDVMLGRGVAKLAAADPDAGLRGRLVPARLGRPRSREPRVAAHAAPPRAGRGPNALEARPRDCSPACRRRIRRDGDRQQPRGRRRARNGARHDAGAHRVRALDRRSREHACRCLHAEDPANGGLRDRLPVLRRHWRGPRAPSPAKPGVAWWDNDAYVGPSRSHARRPTSSSSASTAAPTTTRRPTRGCSTSAGSSPPGARMWSGDGPARRPADGRVIRRVAAAARRSSRRASATSSSTSTSRKHARANCSRCSRAPVA